MTDSAHAVSAIFEKWLADRYGGQWVCEQDEAINSTDEE